MKNAMTIKYNENMKTSCVVTYLGNEVALTNTEEKSLELLFGEMVHRFIGLFVRVAAKIKKFREGKIMKDFRKIKSEDHEDRRGNCFYDYKNMSNLWEDALISRQCR